MTIDNKTDDSVAAILREARKHEVVVDYVMVICTCGDRSETRREFEEHRERAIRQAINPIEESIVAEGEVAVGNYVIATSGGKVLQRGNLPVAGHRPVKDDQFVHDGQLYWVWNVVWDDNLGNMIVILATHGSGEFSSGPSIENSIKRIREATA